MTICPACDVENRKEAHFCDSCGATLESGRRAEADAHLQTALTFYRPVGANWYIRQAETLLAASA